MLLAPVFFLLIPHVLSLNFSFTNFQDEDRISFEKSARLVGTSIDLVTRNNDTAGRATYGQPMHLWDKASGKLTDFSTNFTFVIDSGGEKQFGDGMAFFLAPIDSKLPNMPKVGGGAMGLIIGGPETMLNSIDHPFVAVEFDIFPNIEYYDGWDPSFVHVGVDVDSIRSMSTVAWDANITGGRTNEAFISYNSSTHNLSISFTGFHNNNIRWQHLHQIVDLRLYLPEWVAFGFSAATGQLFATHRINTWSFYSEELPNVAPTPSPSPNPSPRPSLNSNPSPSMSQKGRNATALAIGLGVGGLVFVCGVVLFVLWKNKKKRDDEGSNEDMSDGFEGGTGPKKYSYAELARAANYFKDDQKLGEGGFGGVYRGFLKDSNSYVAIKRISEGSNQGKKEFASEVRIVSQLRHRNLVQLIGWCHERKELLLVYEYMPNGNLDSHLFKNKRLLTWSIRFKIAQGLASALLYLHEEWEQCVVHRDIKSSNVMLDSNFNAKLGDFGLARLVDHTKGAQTTALAGTMGYMAPESVTTGRASKETDVYSFGIVALEIACGRKPIKPEAPENEINIVKWVWDLYGGGRILEAVDSRLEGDFDQDQIKCLMIVGLFCAQPDHARRPSIRQAINVLNFETPFPNLPSTYPILTYNEFPASFSILSSSNASEVSQNQNISCSSNTISSGFTTTPGDNVSPSMSLSHSRKN
ncbi:L-type lectin-domain containing receptor kinase IX.1-like [Prosopis cineraria]|uniref:L-type lectin-domain containing receptor kinase IX.1-like n=1 Tax=Prosopis cineraria TaxID=364024 RepID=UPI00240FCC7F|nr:L-type lectin-domain containing receptor kinase IX.1-like [Prosopis cineraria]